MRDGDNYYDKLRFIGDDHPETYENAVKIQETSRNRILQSFDTLNNLKQSWDFKILPNYPIILTKFGTGGSYNENTGDVIRKISGLFMPNVDPASNPIHEIVHIGVEWLVKDFGLDHSEKEGLVDGLCISQLGNVLPNYITQKVKNKKIFEMIAASESLTKIPQLLEEYIKQYPR